MARRNQNLAGLAALGALGYMLSRDRGAPVESREGVDVVRPSAPAVDTRDFGVDYSESPNIGGDLMSDKEPGWESAVAPARRAPVRTAPARPAPVRPVAAGPQGRSYSAADAQRMREDYYQRNKDNAALRPTEQPLENLSGDLLPIGRFGKMLGRGVQSARNALMTRAAEETPVTFLGKSGARAMGDAGRLEAPAVRQLGSEPGKLASEPGKLTGPSKRSLVERDRAARAAAREAEKEEFNRRGVDRFMESTFEGGMKKGGKVKAKKMVVTKSGGKVSSASKRADGIATKGKTRGKLY